MSDLDPTRDLPVNQDSEATPPHGLDPFVSDPTKPDDTEIGAAMAELAAPLAANTMIDGFRINSLAGRGGMGEVYLALDTRLNRPVALKIVAEACATSPEFVARFDREARAASALSHTNIAQVYSTGRFGIRPYYAMEFIEGRSLAQILSAEGPISGFRCLSYLMQACEGLNAAYEKGIIHRDIKPDNLMLDAKGTLKIVDFGLARWIADEGRITQTSVVMGTPNYMAPEQITGHDVDHRADIYSLGTSFYHLFSGQTPFVADTAVGIMMKHVNEEPPQLKTLNPRIPQPICAIVEKMMAKDPGQRYQTYRQIIHDLKLAQAGNWQQSVASRRPPARPQAPPRFSRAQILTGSTIGVLLVAAILLGTGYTRMRDELRASGTGKTAITTQKTTATPKGNQPPESSTIEVASVDATGPETTGAPVETDTAPPAEGTMADMALGEPPNPEIAPVSLPDTTSPPDAVADDPADRKKREARTAETMKLIASALASYGEEGAPLPRDLSALGEAFDLHPIARRDAWGHDMEYTARGSRGYSLRSAGSDGIMNTDDDLVIDNGQMVKSGG